MITITEKSPDKGYIFKTKAIIRPKELKQLKDTLLKQLKDGIMIYPSEIIELVDIYNINTTTETYCDVNDNMPICLCEDKNE